MKDDFDPIKDLANMNFVERVFFWASFDKARGSSDSYGKLLLRSFYERTRNTVFAFVGLAVVILFFMWFGSLFNGCIDRASKNAIDKQQQENHQYFKQKALEGEHQYDDYLKY